MEYLEYVNAPIQPNLRDYPSQEETLAAWREGCHEARCTAHRLGMFDDFDPDNDNGYPPHPGDNGDWFYHPFGGDRRDMQAENDDSDDNDGNDTEEESSGDNDTDDSDETDEEGSDSDNNDNDTVEKSDEEVGHWNLAYVDEEDGGEDNRDGFHQDTSVDESSAISPVVDIPGVGKRYKSTVINEMNTSVSLSKDRLLRVRFRPENIPTTLNTDDNANSLCLFDDCAFTSDNAEGFTIGSVQRIVKKMKRGRVEYVKPTALNVTMTTLLCLPSRPHRI